MAIFLAGEDDEEEDDRALLFNTLHLTLLSLMSLRPLALPAVAEVEK